MKKDDLEWSGSESEAGADEAFEQILNEQREEAEARDARDVEAGFQEGDAVHVTEGTTGSTRWERSGRAL